MFKKKDVLIIVVLIAAALLLYAAAKLLPKTDLSTKAAEVTLAPDAIEYIDPTSAPETTAAPQETQSATAGPMPPAQASEVKGYVVITVAGRQYGDPIAMDRDKIITIRQDGGKINKVHITPESVCMESSTCANQDCVGQGEVTLENYQKRVLSTYVICLPNDVSIEMVPVEE